MFDIGWSELAVLFVIALVVLGPKDLPVAIKTFSNFMKTMRGYAREFQKGVDQIVREADLEDAKKAVSAVRSSNPGKVLGKIVDPTGEIAAEVKDVEKAARKVAAETPPAVSTSSTTEAATVEAPPADTKPANPIVTEPLKIAPAHSLSRPPAAAVPTASAIAPKPESETPA